MISICIPIYNAYLQDLVKELVRQANEEQIDYEILLIDDHSQEDYQLANRRIEASKNLKYIELTENIGRSAIRNLFLDYACHDHYLFLDCDSVLPDKLFIKRYVDEIKKGIEVVCGGRSYAGKPHNGQFRLRWKYGVKRESIKACIRNKNVYHSFLSNNFLIKKSIFGQIRFNERIRHYGHEDSLFGFELMKNGIAIRHIDNPVLHDFYENLDEFMLKTRQAIENLYFIHSEIKPGKDFSQMIRLLKTYYTIEQSVLRKLIAIMYSIFARLILSFFRAGINSLYLFDLYKLGYLCHFSMFGNKKVLNKP